MPERLIVIASLDGEIEPGRRRALPAHLTMLGWFNLEQAHVSNLERNLAHFAPRTSPLEIVGQDEALYGPDGNVRVRKVGDAAILRALHRNILAIAEACGGELEPESADYVGQHYNPHVSDWDGGGFGHEERKTLTHLQLASKDKAAHPLTRQIIRNFELQG